MTDKFDKIIESARGTHLTKEEKASMRLSLSKMADTTPIKSPFWSFTFVKSYHYVPVFLVLLILIGGGTSILAQKSLPGDALYSMKIDVNEKVESLVAVTPQAQAEVLAVQADRRLAEAQALATKGDLTEAQNTTIKQEFSAKVDSLNQSFAQMQAQGQTESAVEVLKRFDLQVKGRVHSLADVPNATTSENNKKSASDIVAFITTGHESDTNDDSSNEQDVVPQAATMSVMMTVSTDTSAIEASTTASTTAEIRPVTKQVSTPQKREGKNKQSQVRWSWKDNDK